jgi:hypothetical protein
MHGNVTGRTMLNQEPHSLTRNSAALRFSSHYEASILCWRIGARHRGHRLGPHQLWNARDAHLATPGNLPASLFAGPGAGESGADSPGYDHGCGVAGLGNTRAKDPGLRAWSSHRNVGLSALRNTSQLRRAVLLRAFRLVVHTPKVPLPVQRSHFRQRQSCFLPPFTGTAAVRLVNNFVRILPGNESV